MSNIAIISLNRNKMEELDFLKANSKLNTISFFEKEQLLKGLSVMEGIIVHSEDEKDSGEVFDLILSIKKISSIPIWMFLRNHKPLTRIISLRLGALGAVADREGDEEFMLMIENMLDKILSEDSKELNQHDRYELPERKEVISLNGLNHSLIISEVEISLTMLEYRLVSYLASIPNRTFTYEEIYHQLWKNTKGTVIQHYRIANLMFHLRKKLEISAKNPKIFRTIRSVGYMLDTSVLDQDYLVHQSEIIEFSAD